MRVAIGDEEVAHRRRLSLLERDRNEQGYVLAGVESDFPGCAVLAEQLRLGAQMKDRTALDAIEPDITEFGSVGREHARAIASSPLSPRPAHLEYVAEIGGEQDVDAYGTPRGSVVLHLDALVAD